MIEHETRIEIAGEELPAVIEYEPDDGDVLITAVILKRCIKQRGDTAYCPDGSFYKVTFPEFIQLNITQFLRGSQIKALVDEISSAIVADAADARIRQEEDRWDAIMMSTYDSAPKHYEGMPV